MGPDEHPRNWQEAFEAIDRNINRSHTSRLEELNRQIEALNRMIDPLIQSHVREEAGLDPQPQPIQIRERTLPPFIHPDAIAQFRIPSEILRGESKADPTMDKRHIEDVINSADD